MSEYIIEEDSLKAVTQTTNLPSVDWKEDERFIQEIKRYKGYYKGLVEEEDISSENAIKMIIEDENLIYSSDISFEDYGVDPKEYKRVLKEKIIECYKKALAEEEIKHNNQYISKAQQELPLLKSSLQALTELVIDEEPNYVIFLDKSTRIFGSPFYQYLKSLGLEKMPLIRFYNDDSLKERCEWSYKYPDLERFIEEEFAQIKDKKVIFVDEIFHMGRGAKAIKAMKEVLRNSDISYLALTCTSPLVPSGRGQKREIDKLKRSDPKFHIQEIRTGEDIFAYYAKKLYIKDKKKEKDYAIDSNGNQSHYLTTSRTESSLTNSTFLTPEQKRERTKTARKLKQMIYDTLTNL